MSLGAGAGEVLGSSSDLIKVVKRTFTADELKNLFTTPIDLLSSDVPDGSVIGVISFAYRYNYGGIAGNAISPFINNTNFEKLLFSRTSDLIAAEIIDGPYSDTKNITIEASGPVGPVNGTLDLIVYYTISNFDDI